jgi:hypothetical protein
MGGAVIASPIHPRFGYIQSSHILNVVDMEMVLQLIYTLLKTKPESAMQKNSSQL